jgi:hypothetical protein
MGMGGGGNMLGAEEGGQLNAEGQAAINMY